MAFDLHLIILDGSPEGQVVQTVVSRDNVSPEEAVRSALREMAVKERPKRSKVVKKRETLAVEPLTDEEIRQFNAAFPGLCLLDDVTDEQWDRILKGARRMNREGFSARAKGIT